MKFKLIFEEKARFPVAFMCRLLGVSRAGFYAWLSRPESDRSIENRRLATEIAAVHHESRDTYGSPRVQVELHARGRRVCRHRIARLMREQGLRSKRRRRFVKTTDSAHQHPVARNVLERNFTPEAPNTTWAGDITYIPTVEGWLFLAVIIDLYSRRVIGWAMGARIDRQLAIDALMMAASRRPGASGVLHHTDQGSQYASDDYQLALANLGLLCSMSRRGNCWDNAVVESFFGTLKTEFIHHERFQTRGEAKAKIFDFIEAFYNRRRRHSAIGNLSPVDYENAYAVTRLAA